MASVVDICNLGLSLLGVQNISSLSEASTEARACQQFYASSRDGLLAGYPWGFAERSKILAEITNDKMGSWAHCYEMPGDMLKIRLVRPPYGQGVNIYEGARALQSFPHHLSGDKIYSNVGQAVLVYTGRIDDPALYPPLFVTALANTLASWLAIPLTKSPDIQGRMLQLAQSTTLAAQMADANQEVHFYDGVSEFVEARGL